MQMQPQQMQPQPIQGMAMQQNLSDPRMHGRGGLRRALRATADRVPILKYLHSPQHYPTPVPQQAGYQAGFQAGPGMGQQPPRQTRILAFGDSLTYGYYRMGFGSHPYSENLSKILNVPVDAEGLSGERTDQMLYRLPRLLQQRAGKYTHCVILGGTNDLADNISPEKLLNNIKQLHAQAHSAGLKTIAVTIPQAAFPSQARDATNNLIRSWATSTPNVILVDAAAGIPYQNNGAMWDDSLHFSPAGYDRLGELIAEQITRNNYL